MLHKIDAEIGVKEPPGHNITTNNDPGFCTLMKKYTKEGGFSLSTHLLNVTMTNFQIFKGTPYVGWTSVSLTSGWTVTRKTCPVFKSEGLGRWNELFKLQMNPWFRRKKWEREQPTLTHVYFQDRLKAHVHPNSIVHLFCFEMHLLSNAVSWLASTFEECCMTILKMTARETTFFHAWPKHKETVS